MDRRGPLRVGLALVVVLGGCVACGGDPAGPEAARSPSGPSVTASDPATPTPTPTTPAPAASTPAARPDASADLAAFVAAATALDAQLRATAPLVGASVRAETVVVEESTAAAVLALDVLPVRESIPDGISDDVLRPVMVVYTGLVSRVRAMAGFTYAGTYPRTVDAADLAEGAWADEAEGARMVACLANGSEPARRFDRDLAAVRAAAAAAPPVTAVDPTSRAAATLAVRLAVADLRNGGCDACGGYVADGLAAVRWVEESTLPRTGVIDDGLDFWATYAPGTGWDVQVNAC